MRKMKTRAEIEQSLNHHRAEWQKAEAAAKAARYGTYEYERAAQLSMLHGGAVAALEYVLGIERGKGTPE